MSDEKKVNSTKFFDVAIVGAGPAGLTAAIYALRDNKNVILFEKDEVGGQALNSAKIVNIPGFPEISGYDFIENMKTQIEGIESGSLTTVFEEVVNIRYKDHFESPYVLVTKQGEYLAKSIIIATGSKYRTLGVEGEERLIGRGISFCSTCDAPFYRGKIVAVVGGGNSAVTEAIELANFAKKVYILQNLDSLTAEKGLISKLESVDNIEIRTGVTITGFFKYYTADEISVDYTTKTEVDPEPTSKSLAVNGVFLAIGMEPQNEFAKSCAYVDYNGYIAATDRLVEGAGDCLQKQVRQIVTACGDGAKAAVKICRLLNEGSK